MKWPQGVSSAAVSCGIKSEGDDLGLVVFDAPATYAGVFTTNAAAAAPVIWSRARIGKDVRALLANSGNANACTGRDGTTAVQQESSAVAAMLGCSKEDVVVASTGPIGLKLPVAKIVGNLGALEANLSDDPEPFARSLMTTDTYPKLAIARVGEGSVVGVAKGAAMIAPNMATMLAFIVTDIVCPQQRLQSLLTGAVDESFNRISVDACESTNDSVMCFATGRVDGDLDQLQTALHEVCASLAEQIVRDAEGGTKLMRIEVRGASDTAAAVALGKAVAASDLWRCAVAGEDPNWGRVLSALGSCDRGLDMRNVEVSIGSELMFSRGEPAGRPEIAAKVMSLDDFTVGCVVGDGPGRAEVLAADLTTDYVRLNSEITT
jgi:glutamate N-acetyltransferase / amino-acid N-acetyltransferase